MNIHNPVTIKQGFASMNNTLCNNSGVAFNHEMRDVGFLAKLNTFSRGRRRKQEADELDAEARQAMEDPLHPVPVDLGIDGCQMAEGEERSMIEVQCKENSLVKELSRTLIEWINTELVDDRILVRDLEADVYDGQVLQRLIEKLMHIKINQPEVAQTELGQKQRLKVVLDEINNALGLSSIRASQLWSTSAIYNRDLVAILRLLVALARRFAPMIRLPRKVQLTVLVVRKINGMLQHRRQIEPVTDIGDKPETDGDHDAISALVDCAVPEKLAAFQHTLIMFVNDHLRKLNLHVTNLEKDMSDGVYFILLVGLLGNFFVPLHAYHLVPTTDAQRLSNMQLAFELALDSEGIELNGVTPEGLMHHNLKSTLRLLYNLYTRHSEIAQT